MTSFKFLAAATSLSALIATSASAQPVIDEPGLYAFYYPNNDVLNGGRPTPAAGMDARTLAQFNRSDAYGTTVNRRHEAFQPR